MQSQIEFYEETERQFDNVRNRLENLKLELSAYEKIMSILAEHIKENLSVQSRLINDKEDERKLAIVKESHEKLSAKYKRFRVAKMDREEDYKKLLAEKNCLESQLNSMKTQIVSYRKLKEAQDNSFNDQQEHQHHGPAFDYDVETINFLNECNWNLGNSCDRNLAENLLGCFPNGTFLVRSSKTKSNSYALSVAINSSVRHCLIDKIDDEYCFHPPGPTHQFYSSLCNLVMDYRHKSLVVHNPGLDTCLVYPVLSQLKKTKNTGATNRHQAQQQIISS